MKINIAVIPAAGKNSRLLDLPLTKILPKTMLPILNKPILHYIIDQLKSEGIKQIFIIVNNKKEIIRDYFGDGEEYGVKISYIYQKKLTGIADAIKLSNQYINKPFFTILGDTFISESPFKKMSRVLLQMHN